MDLLRTAVVDITTLVAASHALKVTRTEGAVVRRRRLRARLRRDIKGGTVAYIDALARTRNGAVDDALLLRCRVAAEAQMPLALQHAHELGLSLASEPGSLHGMPAVRHDLWRLAHIATHLGAGLSILIGSVAAGDARAARARAARLRRRFRRALIAYARSSLCSETLDRRAIQKARNAALAEIGARGAAQANRLADIETRADPPATLIRQGVAKPLLDLVNDWPPRDSAAR